jgi:hypothetical protein
VVLAYARNKNDRMATATLGFNIGNDGKVVEMNQSEYKKLFD